MPQLDKHFYVSGKHRQTLSTQMEKYFNAGYFLLKTTSIKFSFDKHKVVETCSGCINFLVFDYWCLSWTNDQLDQKKKAIVDLTDEKITEIQKWADNKFNQKEIYWGNALPDLETALLFKNQFFKNKNDIRVYTIYFSETDTNAFVTEFEDDSTKNGDFALRHNLLKRIEEKENLDEDFIGFDFIGVEDDGSFHSFYCHDITKTLIDKFKLKLNEFGLFENLKNAESIKEYLNDEGSGLEPVPWYIVKTKRLKNASS